MAHGTDGEIITYDSSGAPATVGVGTSGQVLTSNGAGSAPSMQDSAGGGKVLQVVENLDGAYATTTAIIPADNTTPQKTEGAEFYTLAITPVSATSKLYIESNVFISGNAGAIISCAIFKDSDANAIASGYSNIANGEADGLRVKFSVSSTSTTTRTYKLRVGGHTSLTTSLNGPLSGARFNGTMKSGLIITEVEA
jgi:hypothetical protein